MIVRHTVFVEEQGVPLENEFDEDDPRSYHWVAYASVPVKARSQPTSPEMKPHDEKMEDNSDKPASTKIPIGTIRLVPGPFDHPHPNGKMETAVHKISETYVKIGRLAVIKEFRKAGISKLLIETALRFIHDHPYEIHHGPYMDHNNSNNSGLNFRGLVLIHAQVGVQKVWKRYGFETDESMGTWDEEGIEHVGMWKRVDVSDARRKSKVVLPSGSS
jgi:predicted GNAT family N-acyltransferase